MRYYKLLESKVDELETFENIAQYLSECNNEIVCVHDVRYAQEGVAIIQYEVLYLKQMTLMLH